LTPLRLGIDLGSPLNDGVLRLQPQVFQVWFEAQGKPQTGGPGTVPQAIVALNGSLTYAPRHIDWTSTDLPTALQSVLAPGGRVLIRIHCSNLFDVQNLMFSASTDVLALGAPTPHLPGGVFESWLFVVLG
jgi:hypothetical protein